MANEKSNDNKKKYASLSTLSTFLGKLRDTFASLTHNHSFNDLEDKPFGEVTGLNDLNVHITNTDDMVKTNWSGSDEEMIYYVKIDELGSNSVRDYILNASKIYVDFGGDYDEESWLLIEDGCRNFQNNSGTIVLDGTVYVAAIESANTTINTDMGDFTFPEDGIYVLVLTDIDNSYLVYVSDIAFDSAGTTIRTLDEKFIPDTIARTVDIDNAINDINNNINASLVNKADKEHSHDDRYYTESEIDKKLNDTAAAVKDDLLNGAGTAYDTLKELGDLIDDNTDALEALEIVANNKADKDHNHDDKYDAKGSAQAVQDNVDSLRDSYNTHTDNDLMHLSLEEKNKWHGAYIHSQSAHARVDATKVEESEDNGYILINGNTTKVYVHPNSSATPDFYTRVGIDSEGHVISGSNPTTLSGYGITDAETKTDATAKLQEAKLYTDTEVAKKADKDHNHDSAYDIKGTAQEKADISLATAKSYTDEKVADLASTTVVDNKITTHNTSTSAHEDIRALISDLTTKLSNFLNVDDETTDQLSEVLTLIENNKGTLESLTTSKVNVSDIVDNLTTNSTSKVLSAAQGVAIKALIDALQAELDSHTHTVSDITDLTVTATELNYVEGVERNIQSQLNEKAPKSAPIFTNSISMGRKSGSTKGLNSVSVGDANTASESYSFASGSQTEATGYASHTEGSNTTASGDYSHAEGYGTTASGDEAHAEGQSTTALGEASHAGGYSSAVAGERVDGLTVDTPSEDILVKWENSTLNFALAQKKGSFVHGTNCLALGENSFAVGEETVASGNKSFASGNQTRATGLYSTAMNTETVASGSYAFATGNGTVASGVQSAAFGLDTSSEGVASVSMGRETVANNYQLVVGKYNVDTPAPVSKSDKTGSLFIVGNGASDTERSNAFAVRADGNGLFAGDIYVGGTDINDTSISRVTTEADHNWTLIYDSGEIPNIANSISGIDVSGYTNIEVLVRCYNDGDSHTTRTGSAIFTAENGKTYQFPVWTNMFTKSISTASVMAQFKLIDGWLICPCASKLTGDIDIFDTTEGGTAGNLTPTGSGMMKCTSPLSTLTISNLDQNSDYYFGMGSRVMVWGGKI